MQLSDSDPLATIRTLVPKQVLETLKRGESVPAFHAVRIHKDGRRLEVSLTVSPLRSPAGEVIGAASEARTLH